MATVKSYTDLKQSRILAEILPHNTADETFERIVIAGENLNIPEEQQYKHNSDMPFTVLMVLEFLVGVLLLFLKLFAIMVGMNYKCMKVDIILKLTDL